MSNHQIDPREDIRTGPMSSFQIRTMTLITLISALDGFDVLVAAYTVPAIAQDWKLNAIQVGSILTAGLVGMGLGAIVNGILGDRRGRRPTTILCLSLLVVGMAAAATSRTIHTLLLWRVLTGFGIGGALANINILAVEFSTYRRRYLTTSVMAASYPVGATLGGFIARSLSGTHGWRAVYWIGSAVGLLLLPLTVSLLPESLDYLITRRPKNALARLNRILRRLGQATVAQLPQDAPAMKFATGSNPMVLSGSFVELLASCTAYLCIMFTAYFAMSWLPRIINNFGFSVREGINAGLILNVASSIGCLVYGATATRLGGRRTAVAFAVGFFVATASFGFLPLGLRSIYLSAAATGFCMNAAITALYALVPPIFGAGIRSTATGISMSVGRVGAALGPYLAGQLIAYGVHRSQFFLLMGSPAVLAALCMIRLRSGSARERGPEAV